MALTLWCVARTGAETLAVVGDAAITTADVLAALGEIPQGSKLADALDGLIERQLILNLARQKGLYADEAEVERTRELFNRAFGPETAPAAAETRKFLGEEIVISKYINLYLYPRIKTDDESLKQWFLEGGYTKIKRAPADGKAREAAFSKLRNEILYHYLQAEITRLLAEEVAAARTTTRIKVVSRGD